MKKKIFWNAFLRYSLEVYLEVSVAYTIKLYALNFSGATESAISIMSITIFIALLIYIALIAGFLLKKFKALHITGLTQSMHSVSVN